MISEIKYYCLVMTENYIENNFPNIIEFENAIEHRLFDNNLSKAALKEENKRNLQLCKEHKLNYILIDKTYDIKINI